MQTSASVDGMTAYFGVVPAALIAAHGLESDRTIHGGVSARAPGAHHLLVALYETASARRITDATIKVAVTARDGTVTEKPLEPITVSSALTYGNYFNMQATGPYEIAATVHRPGVARDAVIHFRYRHWPDRL